MLESLEIKLNNTLRKFPEAYGLCGAYALDATTGGILPQAFWDLCAQEPLTTLRFHRLIQKIILPLLQIETSGIYTTENISNPESLVKALLQQISIKPSKVITATLPTLEPGHAMAYISDESRQLTIFDSASRPRISRVSPSRIQRDFMKVFNTNDSAGFIYTFDFTIDLS